MAGRSELLGAHMSIAGGFRNAPGLGASIGCTAIQIFTKNAGSWNAKPLDPDDVQAFKQGLEQNGIGAAVAHDSYLINLCAADRDKLKRSIDAFVHEIERTHALGLPGLITHPGSPTEKGEAWGLKTMGRSLSQVLKRTAHAPAGIWLETTAGQGTNLGFTFEHLAEIIGLAGGDAQRLGVCMDTAHIFAAGYDLRTKAAWDDLLGRFDEIVGLERLKAVHINDSKKDLGTRVDRHDRVGLGFIGLTALRRVVRDKRLKHIPKILETPGGMEAFAEDLTLLRK